MNADPKERIIWTSNWAFGLIVLSLVFAVILLYTQDAKQLGLGTLIGLGIGVGSSLTMIRHATNNRNC